MFFFFSSRRRHTRLQGDWSSDVCSSDLGSLFFWGTVITCLTGFGIFRHGGFGNPHVLGIVTLIVLGGAVAAQRGSALGRGSRYVATLGYSLGPFLHFIPAPPETPTPPPAGAPLPPPPPRP